MEDQDMSETYPAHQASFGLLPEPERNPASFLTSCILNSAILALLILLGTVAHHEIQLRKMESTEIVFPQIPHPRIKVRVKVPPAPEPKIVRLEKPKIKVPKIEARPETKLPVIKEAMALPKFAAAKPAVALAVQPKPALVHLGDLNGVTPNPNAIRPATVAALGNPYGDMQGSATAPRGIVGSAGFGDGNRSGTGGNGGAGGRGRVAAAGIPGLTSAGSPSITVSEQAKTTPPVLISHSQPEYTSEARQLKIEGNVILRVTITTSGQMVVHSVIRGLGHGLDDAAMRSAPTYKFQPATKDGQPVEYTTNIIIKFQTA
jgi:TonB family protein